MSTSLLRRCIPAIAAAPACALLAVSLAVAATDYAPAYHDQAGLQKDLKLLEKVNSHVKLHELATTAGGRPLLMLEIRPADLGKDDLAPAVLVMANPLGTTPLASEAALDLARMLVDPEDAAEMPEGHAEQLIWYIVPAVDPDGAARYFARPQLADGRNERPVDDDLDGAADEDGPDDLNGDGLITSMLLADPQGSWLLTEGDPRLPKEADPAKGEVGQYLNLVEGRDDDGDGLFNEDGPGGTVPGRNFPHAFEHWTTDGGPWAASENESRALLSFAFDHPEIALVLVFGETNTLAKVPESNRQGEAGGDKYKLPEWMARRSGLDPEQEYALDDLVQMARDFTGNMNLQAEDVLQFLELGAAVNPNRRDLAWWNALAEQYKEHLKQVGLDGPRVDPRPSGPGSLEEWAYYQFGVPAFALDFWTVPKPAEAGSGEAGAEEALTPDAVEKMSRDEFIALGEERIGAFLKAHDAPAHISAGMVIDALKGGMFTTARIAEMMRERAEKEEAGGADPDLKALASFSSERLGGTGYRSWESVTLPDGREALVGGAAPYALRTPPAAMVDSLLSAQLPFLWKLTDWLPRLEVASVELKHRGANVYQVEVFVANRGRIAYPTGQGARCRRPPPVVVTLEGGKILEGLPRQTIDQVPALGAASSLWLVHGKPGTKLTIRATTPSAGGSQTTVTLQPAGGRR
jgi:hypothetical protein